ncbi:hypothetical protein BAZMOX_00432_3 [methanotrophic endosymbiont of Bathymodiolus azoricus (Menez Gwen)]|nr:hypothetical protein BAZMOX_00432_3 [methanotrophic endosymbiont of Bathymodiolus azoricus (Menez Gwen)]
MSSEIENIRQLVTKLDEVQIDLETVQEGLEKNFENYKNISDISSDISEKNQEVLESINTLQIQATNTVEDALKKATDLKAEMSKYYSSENTKIRKDFDVLLSSIENELSTLKSTIKTSIQSAINDVNIDTSDLSHIINEKIKSIDIEPIREFTNNVNKYFEKHKNDTKEQAIEIKTIRDSIAKNKENLEKNLEEYYTEQENWIERIKNQKQRLEKSYKNTRGFLAIMIVSIFIGIGIGVIAIKYVSDKQVIIYQDLDIDKLARLSGDKKYISVRILREEMKNKETELNLLTFVPWWMILLLFLIFGMFLIPKEEEEKNNPWA